MKSFAHLIPNSPFFKIFDPDGKVPIKSCRHSFVRLRGSDEVTAHMLDWEACTEEQKYLLTHRLIMERGGTPDELLAYLKGGGEIPIRGSQIRGLEQITQETN